MHDLAADVKVEIYVDGKPLGEAAARGSSTVSFVESAAGKEFSVALEYLGRKLFGHWALVVVDGVAMEGYTLTPNVREVCAGKLSSNGDFVRKFQFEAIKRSKLSKADRLAVQLPPNLDQLGTIEVQIHPIYERCSRHGDCCCSPEPERAGTPDFELPPLTLPSDVQPDLVHSTRLLASERLVTGSAGDGLSVKYIWDEEPSSKLIFKYRSADSLRKLGVRQNAARKSLNRAPPVSKKQATPVDTDEEEDVEELTPRASPDDLVREKRSPTDIAPKRSIHDRTPPVASTSRLSSIPRPLPPIASTSPLSPIPPPLPPAASTSRISPIPRPLPPTASTSRLSPVLRPLGNSPLASQAIHGGRPPVFADEPPTPASVPHRPTPCLSRCRVWNPKRAGLVPRAPSCNDPASPDDELVRVAQRPDTEALEQAERAIADMNREELARAEQIATLQEEQAVLQDAQAALQEEQAVAAAWKEQLVKRAERAKKNVEAKVPKEEAKVEQVEGMARGKRAATSEGAGGQAKKVKREIKVIELSDSD